MKLEGATVMAGGVSAEVETKPFVLHEEIGKFRIPRGWDSTVTNSELRILCSPHLGEWDERIDRPGFPKPSSPVQVNQTLIVRTFVARDPFSPTFYEDALAFLENEGALFVGVLGLAFVATALSQILRTEQEFTCIDRQSSLFVDTTEGNPTPQLVRMSVGYGRFDLRLYGIRERVPLERVIGFFPRKRE